MTSNIWRQERSPVSNEFPSALLAMNQEECVYAL